MGKKLLVTVDTDTGEQLTGILAYCPSKKI